MRQALNIAARSISSRHDVALFAHPDLREIFPRYLLSLYPVCESTVPLIRAARDAVLRSAYRGTPAGEALAAYYDKRIPEELGHDEWLLEDMTLLGFDADAVRRHRYPPSAAALIGSQYYYINHANPVAFLGYMGALEGFPPVDSDLRAAATATGYPFEAFRTLRKHGNLDVHHRDELNEFLDTAPLPADDVVLVITNAIATLERGAELIEDVLSGHPMLRLDRPTAASGH
jgi:hypothetical protein